MTRWAWLVLVLLAAASLGAAPKAVLRMPASVPTGGLAWFDSTGTVSDVAPVVLCVNGVDAAAPVLREDGTFLGFLVRRPGHFLFEVVAEGAAPGAQGVTRAVAFASVDVSGPQPVAPTVVPTQPVAPAGPTDAGPSAADTLAAGARAYLLGIPGDFERAAADVLAGKIKTVAELNKAVAGYRQAGGKALAAEMDRRLRAMADTDGVIRDGPGVAAALRAVSAAQKGALKP
jgi:hypothetical protein